MYLITFTIGQLNISINSNNRQHRNTFIHVDLKHQLREPLSVPGKFGNQSNTLIKLFIAEALTILLLVLGDTKPFSYLILRFSTTRTRNIFTKRKSL